MLYTCQEVRSRPARAAAITRVPRRRSSASGSSAETIAELPGGRPRPSRKRLARRRLCSWIASIPISSSSSSVGAVAIQGNQAGLRSKRRASLARRSGGAVVGRVGVLARVPAGRDRRELVVQLRPHAHEGGSARGAEPLVGAAGEHVDAARVDGKPAARLRRVHHQARVVGGGGLDHRVEVGELTGGRLDHAHRDDVGALVDRIGQPGHRHALDLDAALLRQERPQERGELRLGRDHACAVRQRRRDKADHAGRVRADRDPTRSVRRPFARTTRGRPRSSRPSPPSSCVRRASRRARPEAPPTPASAAGRSSRCSGRASRAARAAARPRSSPAPTLTRPWCACNPEAGAKVQGSVRGNPRCHGRARRETIACTKSHPTPNWTNRLT